MKQNGKFMKASKIIVMIFTVLGAAAGSFVSLYSLFDVYRAKSGYEEITEQVRKNNMDIALNRERIKVMQEIFVEDRPVFAPPNFSGRNRAPADFDAAVEADELKSLPPVPIRNIKKWNDLPVQQQMRAE